MVEVSCKTSSKDKPIVSFKELDEWVDGIWETFYNEQIRAIFGDKQTDIRYHAMGVNTGMERLVKMMKIGTLSSMLVNQNL